jgi:hypothetical protein
MGGQSSCPGETGTTKIDSRITIAALEYHCGDSFEPRADCDELAVGATATIGVILQNISPSLRSVSYRLDVQTVSPWNAGKYYGGESGFCGASGDSSGLDIKINGQKPSAYMLDGLPYGQSEVRPFGRRAIHETARSVGAAYGDADASLVLRVQRH